MGGGDDRIVQLLNEIQRLSTQGYRSSSANIIDDLLQVAEIKGPNSSQLPSVDALTLFLSRIEQSPANPEQKLNRIKVLYSSGESNSESNNPFRYFLGKLYTAVNKTRGLEPITKRSVDRAKRY